MSEVVSYTMAKEIIEHKALNHGRGCEVEVEDGKVYCKKCKEWF